MPKTPKPIPQTGRVHDTSSNSESIDQLCRGQMVKQEPYSIEIAYIDYYNSVLEEQIKEERTWAINVGPNLLVNGVWEAYKEL